MSHRSQNAYRQLIYALVRTDQDHAAALLSKSLCEKYVFERDAERSGNKLSSFKESGESEPPDFHISSAGKRYGTFEFCYFGAARLLLVAALS